MTLEKAIRTLTFQLSKSALTVGPGLREAVKLGIEALKRCLYIAQHTARWTLVPLPGETRED